MKELRKKQNLYLLALSMVLFFGGLGILWVASFKIPDLSDLTTRRVTQSTKIYDRTGDIILFDMGRDIRRSLIPFEDISNYVKESMVAIEDKNFYSHNGVSPKSFLRAMLVNLTSLSFSQGGSTITQQVVKNSLLTGDKSLFGGPARKIKEWVLAVKLDKAIPKNDILNIYLNEIPFGGNLYGVEEASNAFYNKPAKDITLAEAAYLTAIIKAPTFYSPYGKNIESLNARKNLVLREMLSQKRISQEEFDEATAEEVVFHPRENTGGIKAPHFVFFVIDELSQKYGEEALANGGLRVITSLDYSIQESAESVAKKYGEINQEQFNADNNATVVIDPKSGEILAMTGSRDYFDKKIQGNFNAATGKRQPGSTFKPLVYAALFNKGFTPDSILWDVPTQFSPACEWNDFKTDDVCYSPVNYDDTFRGPMKIRDALSQSINVPAVEGLYLAGIRNAINLAESLGITSLEDESRFGLSLVLGGGEVSLLELVSAYGVFANDGIRNKHVSILKVYDAKGQILSEYTPSPQRVLPADTARKISDILSDNTARTPAYGPNSPLHVPTRSVAVKTGTTNDYKDAWIVGYAPNVVIGAWVGNNANTSMEKKVAGMIVAPMWRELVNATLPKFPVETFGTPEPTDPNLKPILRGDYTSGGIHSVLHFIDKDNPLGPAPSNPSSDPQYPNWERAVQAFFSAN